MPLSNYAKDTFIAPEMSKFITANIPDLNNLLHDTENLISDFVLNSMLRIDLPNKTRQIIFNYLRRCQIMVTEYELARNATELYIKGRQLSGPYFEALHHWEITLGSAYHALLLPTFMGLTPGKGLFIKGDASTEEQLHHLYNSIKHTESSIDCGLMPDNGTLPVWLTNEGIKSVDAFLSYDDLARTVRMLIAVAAKAKDPAGFIEENRTSKNK